VTTRNERRLTIIEAAAELFLSHGSAGVSMRDIAKAANISRATLYTYFGNKNEVFDAAVDGIIFTVSKKSKGALSMVGETASLQEKLFSVFDAQQVAYTEISALQRSNFFYEIWRRKQSMAKEKKELMPYHKLILEIIEDEPSLAQSFPDRAFPDLFALSNTIYLGASAILYSDESPREKRILLKTLISVFVSAIAK
jgi:AcrR family transcriptional regulator